MIGCRMDGTGDVRFWEGATRLILRCLWMLRRLRRMEDIMISQIGDVDEEGGDRVLYYNSVSNVQLALLS